MIFQGRAGENLFRRRHRGSTTEAIRTDLSEAMGKVWEFNDTIDEYMRKAADKVIEDPAGLMESFLARQKFSKYRVKKVLEVMEEAPFNAPMSLFEIAYWVACQKLTAPNYAPRDLGEDEAESLAFKLIKKEVRL